MKLHIPTYLTLSFLIFLYMGIGNAFAQGFKSITELDPISIDAGVGTEDMSQSKVFVHDRKHWTVLANSTGTHLWRLDGKSWTHIMRLTTRKGRADIKVIGNLVHVFVYQSNISHLVSLEYESSTQTYKPWSQRSTVVEFPFNREIQFASIDIDGTGRMWLAYVRNSQVLVQTSTSPYNSWSSPIVLASEVRSDDGAAVIAMPGKIGVFWSNQITKQFGFKTHADGDAVSNWSADEAPASQSALDRGAGMADDHMNLKVSSDGALFCAVKTGYNHNDFTTIGLLVRRPSGNWEDLHNVSNSGTTTPITVLNEAAGKIKVIYASQTYGGDILYKESSTANISFGEEQILMKGGSIRDASASKGTYNSELVIVANDKPNERAVSVLAVDGETTADIPGSISLISPANSSTNVELSPTLSWNNASGADTYQLQVSTSSNFTTTVTDLKGISTTSSTVSDLSNATQYYWRVRGTNGTGDGPWSSAWQFTTLSGSSGGDGDLVGHWKMEEGSGNLLMDHSGYDNTATLKSTGGIEWSPGVEGLGLDLPGLRDRFGEVQNNPSINITDEISISAWIKPSILKTKTILSKVSPNGYQLNTTNKGNLEFWINENSHGAAYKIRSNGTYPTDGNTWMHVVATFDGQTAKIYLNGVEDNSVTFSSPVKIGTNTSVLTIGAYGSSLRFFGSLDEVRLYRKVLNGDEAKQLFSNTSDTKNVAMVAHWKMEEGSGDFLIDHSGNDNTATLKSTGSIEWSQGVDGLGLDLPGLRDRFGEVENNPTIDITDEISVSVWIKPNILKTKTIFSKVSPNGYQLNTTNKGNLEFWINEDSHGTTYRVRSNGTYPTDGNTWMHVVATFDGQTLKIYLNGEEDNSITLDAPVKIGSNTSNLTIGAYESSLRFFGSLDELRLYKGVLSAEEARQIYSNNKDPNTTISRLIQVGELLNHVLENKNGDLKIENVAANSLPDWLTYDKVQNQLIGIPTEKDLGTITLRISNFNQEGMKVDEKYLNLKVEKQAYDSKKIQSREGGKNIKLYPNPVIDQLFMESSGLEQEQVKISIYDTNGKLHLELNTKVESTVTEITQINTVLGSGLYLVIVEGPQFREVFKIFKK